jgi:tetratricopeptide (TPR) repeat protein
VYDPWIYEKLSTFLPARKDEDDQEDEDNDDGDHDGSTSPKKKSVRFNFQKSSKSGGNKNTKKKSPSTSPKNTENNNTSPKNQPTSTTTTTTHPAPATYYDDEDESNGIMTIQIKYYKFSILSFLLFPFLWNGCLRTMKRNIDWHSEFNIYSSALQVCPYSIKALSNYAMLVSATTGEFENSLQAALTAMEYYPENPAAIINAGVAYQKAGQHLKAIELFEFGTQFPLATKSFGYLGSTIYNWIPLIQNPIYKDYLREICLRWISLSLEKGFGPPGILHIGGSVAFDKRDLILAIQYYETAVYYALKNQELRQGSKDVPIEDDVHIAWTYNQIGNCFNDLGNLTKAIEYYEKGLAIDGNSLPLLANSAIVYRVLKNYDKSREMLTRGIALTPGKPSPALLNNLGSLEMELANYAQALSLFEQAYASIQAEKKGDQFVAKQDGVEFRYDAFGTSVEGVIRANIEEAREKLAAATATAGGEKKGW